MLHFGAGFNVLMFDLLFFEYFVVLFVLIYNEISREGSNSPEPPIDLSVPVVSMASKKTKVRGGYRSHAKKIFTECDTVVKKANPPKAQVERLCAILRDKLTVLKAIDEEIFLLINPEEIKNEAVESEDWRAEIQSRLTQLEAKISVAPVVQQQVVAPQTSQPVATISNVESYLPKLYLPRYAGDPKRWQEFWDAFGVVDGNQNIPPVNKFRHLRTLLEGRAAAAISGIQTTDANYTVAVKLLKERFAQKQIVVNAHIEALTNLQTVHSDKDVKGLRNLVDKIDTNVRSLETLGYDLKQYGPFLNPMIMRKLPEQIRLAVTKEIRNEEWELNKILDIIKKELEAREQCAHINSHSKSVADGRQNKNNLPTTASFLSNDTKVTCSFCKNHHLSAKCNIVTDPIRRKQMLSKQGRCFVCLRKWHRSVDCKSNIYCFICKQRHHTAICEYSKPASDVRPNTANDNEFTAHTANQGSRSRANQSNFTPIQKQGNLSLPESTMTMHINTKTSILLQTAKGFISPPADPQRSEIARLIFDTGSKHSYISAKLKETLQLPIVGQETIAIKVFGDETGTLQTCEVVQFCVRSPYNDLSVYVRAYVVPVLCAPLSEQAINIAVYQYPHLAGLGLADYPAKMNEELNCEILVGANFYWQFLSGKCIKAYEGPIAMESILGWILSGPVDNGSTVESTHVNIAETHVLRLESMSEIEETSLEAQVSKFWELESIGIQKLETTVYELFEDEISFESGRYKVKLPCKPYHPMLPDNYQLCRKRLKGTFDRLCRDPTLLQEYDSIIREQEDRGIIERVASSSDAIVGKTTYLPHHPVIRKDKSTTKVRIVYDASAKDSEGTSLNKCLYTGPCLLKTVCEILTRFRLYQIALSADIEKAFLMIAIWQGDRDALRFLWVDNINSLSPQEIIYRFKRVVFGVSCSPFLLNATLKRHIEQFMVENPEVCTKILNSLYADDMNTGGYTIEEVINLYESSKEIMKKGGFNLRKWISNSQEVTSYINGRESKSQAKVSSVISEDDQSFAKTAIPNSHDTDTDDLKILGMKWDVERDRITFNLRQLAETSNGRTVTKRNVLSLTAKIYDPLGMISPVTIMLKVFLQRLFGRKIGWDEILPDELKATWERLIEFLMKAPEISFPRFYFGEVKMKPLSIELVGFCDSSEEAYAACVYAKITVNGKTDVNLVISKTRVAPLKKPTIPRLELLSALILARLISSVQTMLTPLCKTTVVRCFTDSITAMYWIKGEDKEWKTFVENRVQEIRSLVPKEKWNHCPGLENPADIATRSSNPVKLSENSRWFKGPEWLRGNENKWPERHMTDLPEDCLKEVGSTCKGSSNMTLLIETGTQMNISKILDATRFSSYMKLLRVTAYVLRFVKNCKDRCINTKELTAEELDEAEIVWIRDMQTQIDKKKSSSVEKHLDTFIDKDKIIRCQGRLKNSCLTFETRHPILLPREHHITSLIIWECHKNVLHNGTNQTLQELRTRFWVIKGRQLVKKTIYKCKLCKKLQGFVIFLCTFLEQIQKQQPS